MSTILWRGPSRIDGAPIVVIGTESSENRKTGNMAQIFILRADVSPTDAIASGADESICGDCKHRGEWRTVKAGPNKGKRKRARTCYVNVGQSPQAVYRAFRRGSILTTVDRRAWGRGRIIRIGAYGDGAAVPVYVWHEIVGDAIAWTGYTHQWKPGAVGESMAHLFMASVDSIPEKRFAESLGWRTFRVAMKSGENAKLERESVCPSLLGVQCIDCCACDGTARNLRGSIVIPAHGGTAVMANIRALAA